MAEAFGCAVSDAKTEAQVRSLMADGTVYAKDRAVFALVRGGVDEQDAQRRVWGIACYDVALLRSPKGKTHLVRSRRTSACGGFWTYCGRHVFGKITWSSAEGFVLRRLDLHGQNTTLGEGESPGADCCATCARTTGGYGWDPRIRQRVQAKKLSVQPYSCRRGDHHYWDEDTRKVCADCDHSPMPLFGAS